MAALSMTSCTKDFLNEAPLDELSQEVFWNTEAEVLAAVTGVYSGWESGSYPLYMDCASDNAYNQFPWEGYTALGNGEAAPGNEGAAASRFSYTIITRANWVLANIDQAPIAEELLRRLTAEVRFIRAYRYLDMATLFGGVPLITELASIEESNLPRDSREDVIDFVIQELTLAANDLPESYGPADAGRITKGAALGLRARAEAFIGDYTAVQSTTTDIMSLGYALFNDYVGLFDIANEHNVEVILNIEHIENIAGLGMLGQMLPNSMGGWSSIVPTRALVDAYEMEDGLTIDEPGSAYDELQPYLNRDPRLYATIVHPGALYNGQYFDPLSPSSADYPAAANNTSKTGYSFRKHNPTPSQYTNIWSTGLNIILLRYAEILLLNAEAKIELGQIDESVYSNINAVRERAGMPPVDQSVYNTQDRLRELVRRELRVELAGEGRRWFDIVRWQIGHEVMGRPVEGTYSTGTVDPNSGTVNFTSTTKLQAENRAFDPDKNYLWPIPLAAIDNSQNVLTQNPGY